MALGISGIVWPMSEKAKKIPMELREVIADNLHRAMQNAKEESLKKARSFGEEASVGRRTVNRLLNPAKYPEHAPNLETLVMLAQRLGIETWELLIRRGRQPLIQGELDARRIEGEFRSPSSTERTALRGDKKRKKT